MRVGQSLMWMTR